LSSPTPPAQANFFWDLISTKDPHRSKETTKSLSILTTTREPLEAMDPHTKKIKLILRFKPTHVDQSSPVVNHIKENMSTDKFSQAEEIEQPGQEKRLFVKLNLQPGGFKSGIAATLPANQALYESTFQYFPKLPTELQLAIWKYATTRSRVIRIYNELIVDIYGNGDKIETKNGIACKNPIPDLLHACHQSRNIGMEVYQLVPRGYCEYPFYINPKRDVFLMRGTSELLAFRGNADYWFPEKRNQPLFSQVLPMIVFDPSHSFDAASSPRNPNYKDTFDDSRRFLIPGYSVVINRLLVCFEKIVILGFGADATSDQRRAYNKFSHIFLDEMRRLHIIAQASPGIIKGDPAWLKTYPGGVKFWSQERFKRRIRQNRLS